MTDHGIAVNDLDQTIKRRRAARSARGPGATGASGRARLAAARLRARGPDPVSRRLMGGRLAVRATRLPHRRRRPVRARLLEQPFRRSCDCAARRRATSWPGSTATRRRATVPPPRSPIRSPMTTATPARRRFGRPIGRGSSAKSRPSASPRPPRAWPTGTPTRSASAWRCSPSRRRSLRDRRCMAASPPLSTGAATRPSPPWRRAASTPGSTRRPMPASRRWSSTSRAPIRRR